MQNTGRNMRAVQPEVAPGVAQLAGTIQLPLPQLQSNQPRSGKLIMVTNREPYVHTYSDPGGEIMCSVPAGGVTAALDPVMQEAGGVWVAWGSGNADFEAADSHGKALVPPVSHKYVLKRIKLSKSEVNNFYNGYCNEGLWPLSHNLVGKVRFDRKNWASYLSVNMKFASAILEECSEGDLVWIHDYHLTLVPRILKKSMPSLKVVFFWHIPWPQYDVFSICPQHRQIIESLCSCDLVGFHISRYCRNFTECAERISEKHTDTPARKPHIMWFPISVDFHDIDMRARSARTFKTMRRISKHYGLEDKILSCGVDRMDYTKGVPERLEAIEILLDRYPQYRGRYTHIQICSPTRGDITEYKQVMKRVIEITNRVNGRYSSDGWSPLIVIHKTMPLDTIIALYRMSHFAIVSPLADGMNLVAKEFVAAQTDGKGVLMLSEFAGAAGAIKDAVMINPFERDSFAEKIRETLEMSPKDRKKMIDRARKVCESHTIHDWARRFLRAAEFAGSREETINGGTG